MAQPRLRAAFTILRFMFSIIEKDKYNNYFYFNNYIDIYVYNNLSHFTKYTPLYNKSI